MGYESHLCVQQAPITQSRQAGCGRGAQTRFCDQSSSWHWRQRVPLRHPLHLSKAGGSGRHPTSAALPMAAPTLLQPKPSIWSSGKNSFSPEFSTCSKTGHKEVLGKHGRPGLSQPRSLKPRRLSWSFLHFFKALEWTDVFFRTAELSRNSAFASTSWNQLPYYEGASKSCLLTAT